MQYDMRNRTEEEFQIEKKAKLQAYAFIAQTGMLMRFKSFVEESNGTSAEEYHQQVLDAISRLLCS